MPVLRELPPDCGALDDPTVLQVALETIQNLEGTYVHSNQARWNFARNLATALGYGDVVRMK